MSGETSIPIPFAIGSEVWRVGPAVEEVRLTCPECGGKKAHKVILGCGDVVDVDCSYCSPGFEPPRGYVMRSVYGHKPWKLTLSGPVSVESYFGKTEYRYSLSGGSFVTSTDLFTGEAECAAECAKRNADHEAEEFKRLTHIKNESRKSAARKASYARDQIKRHEAEIARWRKWIELKGGGA